MVRNYVQYGQESNEKRVDKVIWFIVGAVVALVSFCCGFVFGVASQLNNTIKPQPQYKVDIGAEECIHVYGRN